MALTDKLTAIANAIRSKTGSTASLTLDGMVTAINGIETGGSSGSAGANSAYWEVTFVNNLTVSININGVEIPSNSSSVAPVGNYYNGPDSSNENSGACLYWIQDSDHALVVDNVSVSGLKLNGTAYDYAWPIPFGITGATLYANSDTSLSINKVNQSIGVLTINALTEGTIDLTGATITLNEV